MEFLKRLFRSRTSSNIPSDNVELVPVFVPALSLLLIGAEDAKGTPLSYNETLEVRDNANCIMLPATAAAELVQSRADVEIDPDNCWHDWQLLRRQLGRKPDVDPGPEVRMVREADPGMQTAFKAAFTSRDDFRALIPKFDPYLAMIKTNLDDGNNRCFTWLCNAKPIDNSFRAEMFEVPHLVPGFQVGQLFDVDSSDVVDWMINDNGSLHGGFTLRYHRSTLPSEQHEGFDLHIGVSKYE